MIITCPACTTRYHTGDGNLGNKPRRVRCAKCAHEWVFTPDAEAEAIAAPADEPDTDRSAELKAEPEPEPPRAARSDGAPEERPDKASTKERRPNRRSGVAPPSPRPMIDHVLSLVFSAIVLAGIVWVLIGSREAIVGAWPAAAGAYSAIGLSVNTTGLEIRDIKWKIDSEDGKPVLTVEGEIENVAGTARSVPPLHLVLRDEDARELYAWNAEIDPGPLAPGQTMPFVAKRESPPLEAHDVEIRFAPVE